MRRLHPNPIITREMRSRMRSWRAYAGITFFLVALSLMAGGIYSVVYWDYTSYNNYGIVSPNIQYGPMIGKAIFTGTFLLLLTVMIFIAPAYSAGALAGEKERQTYDILLITAMPALKIVWGKLGAVFVFLALLIMTSIPILSMSLLFGGVAAIELVIAIIGLLTTALVFAALGLYVSSLVKSTALATSLSFGLVFFLIIGLPAMIAFIISVIIYNTPNLQDTSDAFLILFLYGAGFIISLHPYAAAVLTNAIAQEGNGYFIFSTTNNTVTYWLISPWIIYVVFHLLLSLFLVRLTSRRVARISRK